MRAFWEADSPNEAEKRVAKVVAAGGAFDEVLSRLKVGRPYGAERSGRVELPTTVRLQHLDNVAEVPAEYTPATRWALRVSLHGGVGREAPKPGETVGRSPTASRRAGDRPAPAGLGRNRVVEEGGGGQPLYPRRPLKRRYNIDERRIYLTGISDGGTGAYFFAMRSATAWAACLPLNGHPSVLANPDTGVDGELFSGNLVNCPLHAVNGGRDRSIPPPRWHRSSRCSRRAAFRCRGRCIPRPITTPAGGPRSAPATRRFCPRIRAWRTRTRCRGRRSAPTATTASAGW
jgi:hypothetical protein